MTENMTIALTSVNKFLYFSWNYGPFYIYEWTNMHGEEMSAFVPKFLTEVKWTTNFDHIYELWKKVESELSNYERIPLFYSYLDKENKIAFGEWIIMNFNDEPKLF